MINKKEDIVKFIFIQSLLTFQKIRLEIYLKENKN